MKVATILPEKYLIFEIDNNYHLCLAHLMAHTGAYRSFFTTMAMDPENFVIMDNGIVEGEPMEAGELLLLARDTRVQEVILPDVIHNKKATLLASGSALKLKGEMRLDDLGCMVVPQGRTLGEWQECLLEMLTWPVRTIGISKFINDFGISRCLALESVPELLQSDKEIHLLGCAVTPEEIYHINQKFPGRIRGTDSAIATAYTAAGARMWSRRRPKGEIDFFAKDLDEELLWMNRIFWRKACLCPSDIAAIAAINADIHRTLIIDQEDGNE
jgi:hypothetical protein